MKTSRLDYKLPEELIAKYPAQPRDSARLLVINRKSKKIEESTFGHIGNYLGKGDVLVLNKSKVFAARTCAKDEKNRSVEVFFLAETGRYVWEILIGGRVKDGARLYFDENLEGVVQKGFPNIIKVNKDKSEVYKYLDKFGRVPLPPYIKREANEKDKKEYQNVFAKVLGSAAAPTAGMHFTSQLLKDLQNQGVQIEYVTLHVGLGTFAPIKTDNIEDHDIHEEHYSIDQSTKERILQAREEKRRIIACGTTSLRVLESMSLDLGTEKGSTKIYIFPGYKFQVVNGLITNFHTPKSSLLALVWAFGGERLMKRAYNFAIKKKYRFFSYGDGMIIL